jgi:hypothetical protein
MDKIYNNIINFQLELQDSWWKNDNTQNAFNKLLASIEKFKPPTEKDQIERFKQDHIFILYKIYEVILGEYADSYIPFEYRSIHRSPIDKLYGKLNLRYSYFKQVPTKIFNEFIKGITYFRDEAPADNPRYHRLRSCGPKNKTIISRFENPSDKYFVRKCYIERSIYNQIYKHFFEKQDLGHLNELKNTERYYIKHFPNEHLQIRIVYDPITHYPYRLILTDPLNKRKETYTKHWNSEIVNCELNINGIKYFKINTFDHLGEWILNFHFGTKRKV